MTVFLAEDQVVDQPMRTTWIGTGQGMCQWDRGTMTGCRPGGEGCCNYIRCFSYSFATINFIAVRPVWR